jgi:hypothetical protein
MSKRKLPYRYGVPAKYLKGLSDEEAKKRATEIKRRGDEYEVGKKKVDGKIKTGAQPDTKDSPSTKRYHQKYGKPKSKKESYMQKGSLLESVIQGMIEEESKEKFINKVHNDTGISKSKLNKVYARGIAAAKSSGHRPGANPVSWAKARVYSFVEGDPKHDQDLRKKKKKSESVNESAANEGMFSSMFSGVKNIKQIRQLRKEEEEIQKEKQELEKKFRDEFHPARRAKIALDIIELIKQQREKLDKIHELEGF